MYFVKRKSRRTRGARGLGFYDDSVAIPRAQPELRRRPIAQPPCSRCARGKFLAGLGATTCEFREGGFRVCTDSDAGPSTPAVAPSQPYDPYASVLQRGRRSTRPADQYRASTYQDVRANYFQLDTSTAAGSIADIAQQPASFDSLKQLASKIPPLGWAAIAGVGVMLLNRKRGR